MKTTEKRRHIFGPIAFILAFAMLAASSMPVGASDDEALSTSGIDAQECVPIAEETWVLGLLDGDLPLDQLKSASLSDNDLPYVISRSLADERQHVNRLYEQEPDDYTVMFQNLDGGKTVYIFSVPVKSQSIEGSVSDMRAEDVISQTTVATAGVGFDCTSEAASVTFGGDFLAERLGNSASDHPLFDYNIGHCDVMRIGSAELYGGISSDGVDITRSAREWGKASDEQKSTFSIVSADLQNMSGSTAIIGNSVTAGDIICISMTYSTIAGEYALKHDTANKYLSNVNSTVKCGSYAMADSESSVVYSSYSSSATNQKWTFTADYSRIRDELQFSGIDIVFPVGGDPSITSGYGFREYTGYSFHDGVDIGVYNVGLKAPFDGTIVFVGTNSSDERRLYIVLKSNEYSNLYTHFYHLSSIDVIENQVVSKGETLGLTGSTGLGSGAHLHLIFSASSGNGPNNYIHTFDPLWFYPNIQFSRNDSTDSIIGGIRQ